MASNGSWMSHMNGAAILLKMRSEAATQRPVDLEVSAMIIRQMVSVTKTMGKK